MRKKLVVLSILAFYFLVILSIPTLTNSSYNKEKTTITVKTPEVRYLVTKGNDPEPELDEDPCPSTIYPNHFNSSEEY